VAAGHTILAMRVDPRNAVLSIVALATLAGIVVLGVSGRPAVRVPSAGPASPIAVPIPPVGRNVYLAPFGDFPRAKAEALVAHYRDRFDLTVEVMPSIPLPAGAFDAGRNQVIAERLNEALAASGTGVAEPEAVIIGLTDLDMYIERLTWDYAYGLRSKGSVAVVSTARLNDIFADEAKQMERLQKIVTKDLGILYYGLSPSDDPRSVLYRDILGPLDLDRVSEDF
jgi:predicted Zn-dependent protease